MGSTYPFQEREEVSGRIVDLLAGIEAFEAETEGDGLAAAATQLADLLQRFDDDMFDLDYSFEVFSSHPGGKSADLRFMRYLSIRHLLSALTALSIRDKELCPRLWLRCRPSCNARVPPHTCRLPLRAQRNN